MKREYNTGVAENITFFIGNEVEKTGYVRYLQSAGAGVPRQGHLGPGLPLGAGGAETPRQGILRIAGKGLFTALDRCHGM